MKKFLPFLSFALLISAVASAQGFRYGITGGMNLANYAMDVDNLSFNPDSRVGFRAGFRMEMDASSFIYDGFFLTGEVLLSSKGAEVKSLLETQSVKSIARPYYLEIPMHIGYQYLLGKGNVGIFGSFGPYFGIGLFGDTKLTDSEGTTKPDIFTSDGLKRFDFGLGLRAGVSMFKHYRIYLGYDWGLINISQSADSKINNRNFYVGAAYMF
ncbi:MAG: PorT family protein [Alistipes sp.]|nr:PorT family protein [Alistipes sp.]